MNLPEAKQIAENLVEDMNLYCEKIIIAGSIRRGKADVKDIEIVAVAKYSIETETTDNLFEPYKQVSKNLLYDWAVKQDLVMWIKPGTSKIIAWQPKADGKYWRGLIHFTKIENHQTIGDSIKLDLFLAAAANFGVIQVIRTGPAEFSQALVSVIKNRTPFRVAEGNLTIAPTGEFIPCETEEDFFKNAGLKFVPVEKRSSENPYKLLEVLK